MLAINIPTNIGIKRSAFYLSFNVAEFQSPMSRVTQRDLRNGSLWISRYTIPKMKRETAAAWIAFFTKLEGKFNTFNAYDANWKINIGISTGSPLVNGASQTGSSLITDGWTPSTKNMLMQGDYFSVNGELKQVTDNVNSDSGGNATISFKPALRESPTEDAAITVNPATTTMYLLSNSVLSDYESDENGIYNELTFSGAEAIT